MVATATGLNPSQLSHCKRMLDEVISDEFQVETKHPVTSWFISLWFVSK